MRTLILILCVSLCALTPGLGQLSVGLKAGTAADVNPGTNYIIVNRTQPAQMMLFNVQQVSHGEQIGLALRYEKNPWWFMTEVMYATSYTKYSMAHVHAGPDVQPAFATEKRQFIDIPVSAGVKLGIVDIFSGFTFTRDLSMDSELYHVAGYEDNIPAWSAGWHSGIGVRVQQLTFDIRYQQTFANYGQNRYINGQELTLYNAPGRLVVVVGFRLCTGGIPAVKD